MIPEQVQHWSSTESQRLIAVSIAAGMIKCVLVAAPVQKQWVV